MVYILRYVFVSFLQESEVQGVHKDVFLLLALYREITLGNTSFQQNVSEEVRECSKSLI